MREAVVVWLQTDYVAFADRKLALVGRIEVVIHNASHGCRGEQRTDEPERGGS